MGIWREQAAEAEWLPGLNDWFGGATGAAIVAAEQALIDELLEDSFGYNQLLLSLVPATGAGKAGRVQRQFRLGSSLQLQSAVGVDGVCDFQHLPIESESLDVLIIQHVLEFVENPHLLMREASRVLVPRGRLVVLNFNPLSLWGLLVCAGRLRRHSIWQTHLLASRRVADLLGVLDFQVDSIDFAAHAAPLEALRRGAARPARPGRIQRRVPLGCSYVLSAVKHRARMNPIRPRWQSEAFANVRPIAAARNTPSHLRNR